MVARLGEVMWVVDLNRQSLDRVVPDIAAGRLAAMFEAAGWHTVMVKYGPRLQKRPNLRARIDAMPNEEYQRLLRADAPELRERIEVDVDDLDDADLLATFRDLGGHDLASLVDGYRQADEVRDRPSVVFAYTIKGWSLPTEGHPANHSALLNPAQYRELAAKLGEDADDPFAPFAPGSPEARLCEATGRRLKRGATRAVRAPKVPPDLGRTHSGRASTQQAFGRFFVDLVREAPDVAERVVTVSPDVGTSTNLGGWINKAGIWSLGERIDWFADDTDTLVRWREHDHGRHIELGIAEVNLVGMLGELGATWSRDGQPLLPVGTIYDPFVARALEPWSFGIYAGGQSILVGTPSGVTLGPEGGAHQSVITPSVGIEQPGCVAYEPAFGQDFEWCFLHALSQLGRPGGTSAYFRLSTRPIDQGLHTGTREGALAGGYRLRPHDAPQLVIAVMGALVPEALDAADTLTARRRPRRRGRVRDQRRPAVPLLPGPLWPRRRRSADARRAVPPGRPDRQPARRPPAHAQLPRLADHLPGRPALRPGRRHRRALRAPRDRRRVGRRRRARPPRVSDVTGNRLAVARSWDSRPGNCGVSQEGVIPSVSKWDLLC